MKVDGHLETYRQFVESVKRNLEGELLPKPLVEDCLIAPYHIIDAVFASMVNTYQNVRRLLSR